VYKNGAETQSIGAKELVSVWLRISLLSFGGGTSTLALIRREFSEKRELVSEAEFSRTWAICQLAPGINLVALAVLLGRRVAGKMGVAVSMLGLLGPSVLITVLLTAGYAGLRDSPEMKHAMVAVLPAIAGVGMATAVKMIGPVREQLLRAGRACYLLHAALFIAIAACAVLGSKTLWLLLASATVGAILSVVTKRQDEAVPSEV
jgi:chromate transporter